MKAADETWAGYEAVVRRYGNRVIKRYLPLYFEHNRVYRRRHERFWLRNFRSPCWPMPIASSDKHLELQYLGNPIGRRKYQVRQRHRTPEFVEWLNQLEAQLSLFTLSHCDIHSKNILWSQQHGYQLIDFTWAQIGLNQVAPYVGAVSDTEAISRLRQEAMK